ncbi:hypothetical protein [Olleya sp. HaHaR_3_96]|uniref:hypothetical protein n=1 Tax=Olleya sp. HaHaR_3_96 TaxID=2745560 RepID=UPI001C4EF6BC|nr:hypothetical protein [Olleya sp. HaHaR_3_96]QXP59106.1 hypothetical protein H0I26_14435 [Olleya sp. HaHaR_3_96]
MKLLYKLTLCLLLPLFAFSNTGNWDGKHTKKKTITKEYTVNDDATLKIANKYGNLDIITWTGNTITIEVTITTNGNDADEVANRANEIDVEFSANASFVSAETVIGKKKKNAWWNWSDNDNVNMKINYVVKLPITNNVNLNNDYGNITIDTLEGHAEIHCDYGKITTKELLADNNVIYFDYTNNSYFEYIKSGKINADYSGFTVAKTKDLNITADYTKSLIEIAENINYNCDYGSLRVNKLNSISGNGNYLTVVLGDVYKNVNLNADYGSIKIGKMTKNAKNINIESDYVGIKIGIDPEYAFNFDISLEYGGLNGHDDFEIETKSLKNTDKYYSGFHYKKDSGNLIKINSEYGSVSFENK